MQLNKTQAEGGLIQPQRDLPRKHRKLPVAEHLPAQTEKLEHFARVVEGSLEMAVASQELHQYVLVETASFLLLVAKDFQLDTGK